MTKELIAAVERIEKDAFQRGFQRGYESAIECFKQNAASYWRDGKPKISGFYLVQSRRKDGGVWITTDSYCKENGEWLGTKDVECWANLYPRVMEA